MKNILKKLTLKIFDISIQEVALSGIFVGLYVLFNMPFLKIAIPGMQISLKYPFIILMGLLIRPTLSIMSSIIADNLSTLIGGSIGAWSWQYAIIAPMIVLIVLLFKHMFTTKSEKIWWVSNAFLFLTILISSGIFYYIFYTYPNRFDILNNLTMKILFLILLIIIILVQSLFTFFYWYKKKKIFRNIISILGVVFIVVIIAIWAWGPIAMMIYFKRYGIPRQAYEFYLFQRILKTPFIVPIYTIIIISVYQAAIIVQSKSNKKNSW